MPLVPIDLRPGVYKNGTPYSGKSRWADSNLARWKDGAIRVIGGWQRRITTAAANIPALFGDATTEAPRNVLAWTSNTGARLMVVGTNLGLYAISSSGVVTDITPAGFTAGDKNSGLEIGYGTSTYGTYSYGTARGGAGAVATPVASWSFALWGEDLLAQFRDDGPIYLWSNGDAQAADLTYGPDATQGIIVTDERIVMTIGGTDKRAVTWSDSEDYTDWTPLPTNQAGGITLSGNGALIAITKVQNQILVLGENEAHAGRYLGPPYIYGFERIGDNCGPISANSLVTTDRFAIWLGDRNVWMFDGTLRMLDSDLADFFLQDAYGSELSKTYGFANSSFDEVWWVYQSNDSTTNEPDSYICYDYAQNHWTKGKINRTIGADKGSTSTVVMVSPDGIIYNHELDGVSITTGTIPYVETGPLEIGAGDQQSYIDYIYPDELAAGSVNLLIKTQDMPNASSFNNGPYDMANPIPVRARGRQFALRFEGRTANWMVGVMRANVKLGGRK